MLTTLIVAAYMLGFAGAGLTVDFCTDRKPRDWKDILMQVLWPVWLPGFWLIYFISEVL